MEILNDFICKISGLAVVKLLIVVYKSFAYMARKAMGFVLGVCAKAGITGVLSLSVIMFAASFVLAFRPGLLGSVVNHLGGAWVTAFAILLSSLAGFLFAESYTVLVAKKVEDELQRRYEIEKGRESEEGKRKALEDEVAKLRDEQERLLKNNDTDRSDLIDMRNKYRCLEKELADEKRRSLDVTRLESILELTLLKLRTTIRDFQSEWLEENVQCEQSEGGFFEKINPINAFSHSEPNVRYYRNRRLGYAEYDACVKLGIDLKSLRFKNEGDVIRVSWRKAASASVESLTLKRKLYAKEKVYLKKSTDVSKYDEVDENSFVLNEVVMSDENGRPQVDKDRCVVQYEPDPRYNGEVAFSKDDEAYKGWDKQCDDLMQRVFKLKGREFEDAHERMRQLARTYLTQFLAPIGKRLVFSEYEAESDVEGFVTLDRLVSDFNKGNVDRLLELS